MSMTIGQLERALLAQFPASDAESWDRTGLVVGDPGEPVRKVAIALDPTISAIEEAARSGANVLVTHHPPFLDAPNQFQPANSVAVVSGANVWAAIRNDVALMCFHTALDVSHAAQIMLPGMIGATQTCVLDPLPHDRTKGYGQLCTIDSSDGVSLSELASICLEMFDRAPRVWGNPDAIIRTVVTGTGSGGNLTAPCIAHDVDCLICGELKYHAALDLSQAGVNVIELGHDVSELPLTSPLREAVKLSEICDESIIMIDQNSNWHIPAAH